MKKIIAFLAKLGFWPFVILFTAIALITSEMLVVLHSYWLTGSFFDRTLLTVGFTIPIVVGLTVFSLIALLIRSFQELENEKNNIIALQKETENNLHDEKKRALRYLDITGTLIVALDTDANIVLANNELCKALGYESEKDLLGKNWIEETLPKEDHVSVKEACSDVMRGNIEPYRTYETRLLQKDGSIRLVKWHNEHIRDNDGNIEGILSSGTDITKSREDDEKIRKSESYQRAILDSFPFLIWLKDTQSNFLAVNKSFANAAGAKNTSELIGKNDLDYFPKDLSDAYRADDKAVMKSLQKKELEEIIESDGERKWFQTYKAPILDKEGNLFGTVGFARDITNRKIMEDKLKLSASVFTHTHEGILISDKDNNIVDVNEAFTTITGYSRDDVLGKKPNILKSNRHDKKFYSKFWESLNRDGVWKGELWNRRKNGAEYVENATISVIYDNNKNVQNYISMFTDITQQKLLQQKLEHSAYYDALTDLPNRILFADRMKQAISQAVRKKQLIAIAYIDIDGFKQVNDTYGHEIGDKLLILLSEKMTKLLRESDTISRVGGDEFIALFVDIQNKEVADVLLNRLIDTIAEPVTINNFSVNVSASIGVTFYPQKDKLDSDQVIRQADQAMYQAKLSGKNQYIIFDSSVSVLSTADQNSALK
ncbi:PAS domain S-box protein [Sulfurimonas sp.]|uniref:PAS domain S-box protein n=1 Tax=Sulfurimonas sp. TaxID=2022749 RepID=UPI003565156B